MPRKTPRVTLIHNPKAGDGRHCRAGLVRLLERAGYAVSYVNYKQCDLREAVRRPADIVAVAGGDGTAAKVAAQARPDGPPLAILPLGTANNMAKSLGLDRPLGELADSWSAGRLRPFHLIAATGPWGHRRIAEGVGFGALEQAIAVMPKDPGFAEARTVLAEAAIGAAPEHLELRLDGERLERPFAMLEVTTVPLVGPNLRLAAAADPSRPKFAVCFVADDAERRQVLARWLAEPGGAPAPVALRTVARATITGRFRRVRLNGQLWQMDPAAASGSAVGITLASEAEPLRVLTPG